MPHRLLTATLALTGLALSMPAQGQAIDPQFRSDIETLFQVTGAGALGAQMATMASNQVIDAMRQAQPEVPERVATVVKETLSGEFAKAFEARGELMATMVEIYARHFTHAEVKALIAFYATDAGRKMVAVLPLLTQDSGAAGQRWAQQNMPGMMERLEQRLRAEGFVK